MLVHLIKKSKNLIFAALFATILFSLLNIVFVQAGLMSFDLTTFGGFLVVGLPFQSIGYNLLYVFLGIGLYKYLNYRYPDNFLERFSLTVSHLLMGICFAFGFFGYAKLYTITIVVVLFLLLVFVEYGNKLRFMYKFYRAFVAMLIPIWFVNHILISKKGARFNPNEVLNIAVGDVPVENFFYALALLLTAIFTFEKLNARSRA